MMVDLPVLYGIITIFHFVRPPYPIVFNISHMAQMSRNMTIVQGWNNKKII